MQIYLGITDMVENLISALEEASLSERQMRKTNAFHHFRDVFLFFFLCLLKKKNKKDILMDLRDSQSERKRDRDLASAS